MALKLPIAQPAESSPARKWDHRKWGTISDPAHKSDIGNILGQFGCTEAFRRNRQRELDGTERAVCAGKTAMGTAVHETIARALRKPDVAAMLTDPGLEAFTAFRREQVEVVLRDEFARATKGLEVVWYGKSNDCMSLMADSVEMVLGLFANLHKHVAKVELVEAGFIALVDKVWTEGHIDLVYRPREDPDALAITDWKTGDTKPHQITLDHGYESGLYSSALKSGLFLPTTILDGWRALASGSTPTLVPLDMADTIALAHITDDRAAMHLALRGLARRAERGEEMSPGVVRFGEFPKVIRLTHLADYVPYERKGTKTVERAEELEHWGLTDTGKVNYEKGMARGPAWYRVRRTEQDIPRLEKMLRSVVALVRMGHFVADIGEKCTRCSYRESCLTTGYELRGDSAKQLNQALRGLDLSGVEGLDE